MPCDRCTCLPLPLYTGLCQYLFVAFEPFFSMAVYRALESGYGQETVGASLSVARKMYVLHAISSPAPASFPCAKKLKYPLLALHVFPLCVGLIP